MKRIWIAFLLCALAYPFAILLSGHAGAIGGAIMVATFTVIGCLIGAPIFVWYRGKGWLKIWQFAFGGGAIGAVVSLPFLSSGSMLGYFSIAAVFVVLGSIHAVIFWLLAIFKNEHLQT